MQFWRFLAPSVLGFTSKNLWHAIVDKISGASPRPVRAMEYVAAHAKEGDAKDVLSKLDDFALSVRWLMSIGPNKDQVIAEAKGLLPDHPRVLELGAYAGYSSIYMADVFGAGVSITSIEISKDNVRAACGNIEHAGMSERVTVVHGSSTDTIPTLKGPFDLIFLDHNGRVTATHRMKVEPPRRDDESDPVYQARLASYPSVYPAQFVIELRQGTLERLDLRFESKIDMNLRRLKASAR